MVSIIVPFRDAMPLLADCCASLDAVLKQSPRTEVILVDNGSSDGSREYVERWLPERARLLSARGLRVGGVRNAGAAIAQGEHLAFVDSDCVVPPDFVARVQRAFQRTGVDAVGRRYGLPGAPHWIERTWFGLHDSGRPARYLPGGNLAITREAFTAIGGFDERCIAGEDAELCARLLSSGRNLAVVPDLEVIHLGNPKTIRAFWRQQVWHGHGRHRLTDLPFVATLCYGAAAAGLFGAGVAGMWAIAGLMFLAGRMVPIATVLYRRATARSRVSWLLATLLYEVYFAARLVALLRPRQDAGTTRARTEGAVAVQS